MRNNHAKECADDAVVQCPLTYHQDASEGCTFYTTLYGSKVQILARLKTHIRKAHTEEDYKEFKEAKNEPNSS